MQCPGSHRYGGRRKRRRMGAERPHPKGRGRQAKGRLYRRGKPSHHLSRYRSVEEGIGKASMPHRPGCFLDGDGKAGPCRPSCECFCGKERNVYESGTEGSEVESSSDSPPPIEIRF